MSARERVLTAIAQKEPDRVPYNLMLVPDLATLVKQHTGTDDYAEHFDHDVRFVTHTIPEKPEDIPVVEWTPEPTPEDIAKLAEATRAYHERGYAVCGRRHCGVYEQAKHWIGPEAAIIGPYENPKEFTVLLDRITEWKCSLSSAYATAGTDIVWIGDDLGTQRSLVMSPAQYREWYKPRHRYIVERIRAINDDVKIAFHCCGHVTPLIGDLIEVGVDILQAVQAECMDLAELKQEFGSALTFWGGVGAQSVFARTTPEQVIEGVRSTLRVMAPGGGYIASPCHTLTEEVPWESIVAFHKGLEVYGAYPNPGDN